MDRNDRQAIETLFDKLATVERQSPQRDSEADAFIRDRIARQPGAPYYMAQTIVVQEQALAEARMRLAELEAEAAEARPSNGGLFGGLFGERSQPSRARGSVPRAGSGPRKTPQPQTGGGGFLAGAAQTALGVTGGVLLGNAIAGMFGGHEAKAAEPSSDTKSEEAHDQDGHDDEPQMEEAGYDDAGGDFGDFDMDI